MWSRAYKALGERKLNEIEILHDAYQSCLLHT